MIRQALLAGPVAVYRDCASRRKLFGTGTLGRKTEKLLTGISVGDFINFDLFSHK